MVDKYKYTASARRVPLATQPFGSNDLSTWFSSAKSVDKRLARSSNMSDEIDFSRALHVLNEGFEASVVLVDLRQRGKTASGAVMR